MHRQHSCGKHCAPCPVNNALGCLVVHCRWQESARQEDALARQQRIDKLRQEMSTAAGAAAAAKAALQAAKAAAGAALKQHRAELEAERGQQQQQERELNADKVQEVAAGREKARKAQV